MQKRAAGLLHYMPIIVKAPGISQKDRQFCVPMISRSRRGPFMPSVKQAHVVLRFVDSFRAKTMGYIHE